MLRPGRWVFCSIFARVACAGETSVPTAQRARVLRVEVAARMRRSEMRIGNGPRFRRASGSSGLYLYVKAISKRGSLVQGECVVLQWRACTERSFWMCSYAASHHFTSYRRSAQCPTRGCVKITTQHANLGHFRSPSKRINPVPLWKELESRGHAFSSETLQMTLIAIFFKYLLQFLSICLEGISCPGSTQHKKNRVKRISESHQE